MAVLVGFRRTPHAHVAMSPPSSLSLSLSSLFLLPSRMKPQVSVLAPPVRTLVGGAPSLRLVPQACCMAALRQQGIVQCEQFTFLNRARFMSSKGGKKEKGASAIGDVQDFPLSFDKYEKFLEHSVDSYKKFLSEIKPGVLSPKLFEGMRIGGEEKKGGTIGERAAVKVKSVQALEIMFLDEKLSIAGEDAIRSLGLALDMSRTKAVLSIALPKSKADYNKSLAAYVTSSTEHFKNRVRKARNSEMADIKKSTNEGVSVDMKKRMDAYIDHVTNAANSKIDDLTKTKLSDLKKV